MTSYCKIARGHPLHGPYHDLEYGFPTSDESALFERLLLEINQAGLSWELMLKKREGFRRAYAGFDVDRIAAFDDADVARLLDDANIVRNRLKVAAAIHNARTIQQLRTEHGGFWAWLMDHHPRHKADWVRLFRRRFRFVGGEIVGEFLMSLGILEGAHDPDCPVHAEVLRQDPPWARSIPTAAR